MSAKTIRTALLSKGYFPKELPPPFTTETFGQSAEPIIADWQQAKLFSKKPTKKTKTKLKANSYTYDVPKAEMEIISTRKLGFERRNIGITHPIPQALLAEEIATNYAAVQKWLCRQTYSLDEIRVSEEYNRSIKFRASSSKEGVH